MNRLSAYLSQTIGIEPWLASLIVIVVLTLVINQIALLLLRKANAITDRTRTVWDDALVQTASKPIVSVVWLAGLGYMLRVIQTQVEQPFL
ncbi:MAG: hypothetical protein ABIN96_08760, partial [Rubrivivax sp.]